MFDIYLHITDNKKLLKMGKETADELKALAKATATSLANIRADITTIKESLPTAGGLTEGEVDELRTELNNVATEADVLDKENE